MASPPLARREALAVATQAAGAAALASMLPAPLAAALPSAEPAAAPTAAAAPGRLRQSVCRWPFAQVPLPEFARTVKAMGLEAIDLLTEDEWAPVRDAGLLCSMVTPTRRPDFIATGLGDRTQHAMLLGELERAIEGAARFGWPNVITMPGNRRGRRTAELVDATIDALRRIAPLAEERRVTICLELLNSRVDHADFLLDRTDIGVAICEGVGSPRVKLLYDIYHMQIMEGDLIRTLRTHARHIAHLHTAGVPGRHELGDAQELHYPAIMRAVAELGFTGFVAHEFIPTGPWEPALRDAVARCTV
jgi:hydroxypyruvate isomerase